MEQLTLHCMAFPHNVCSQTKQVDGEIKEVVLKSWGLEGPSSDSEAEIRSTVHLSEAKVISSKTFSLATES